MKQLPRLEREDPRCGARESGFMRCELPAGHGKNHWISDESVRYGSDRSGWPDWSPRYVLTAEQQAKADREDLATDIEPDECPDCEEWTVFPVSIYAGGGVKCANCPYWFCY